MVRCRGEVLAFRRLAPRYCNALQFPWNMATFDYQVLVRGLPPSPAIVRLNHFVFLRVTLYAYDNLVCSVDFDSNGLCCVENRSSIGASNLSQSRFIYALHPTETIAYPTEKVFLLGLRSPPDPRLALSGKFSKPEANNQKKPDNGIVQSPSSTCGGGGGAGIEAQRF